MVDRRVAVLLFVSAVLLLASLVNAVASDNVLVDLDDEMDAGRPILHYALITGNYERAHKLAGSGVGILDRDVSGRTSLHWAAATGDFYCASIIVQEMKSDPKLKALSPPDYYEETPLHWASSHGHTAIVHLLLREGANTQDLDMDAWTALHWAAMKGHFDIAELLVNRDPDLLVMKDTSGKTPEEVAHSYGESGLAEKLKVMRLDE